MTGFDLPQNFHSDPKSLLRRTRARLVSPQRSLSVVDPVIASSSAPRAMAQKTLRDYSAPSASQVPTGPAYFCYQGCIARCNPAPSVSVFSLGESEAMVLC